MKKGIISVLSAGIGVIAGIAITAEIKGNSSSRYKELSEKHLALMLLLNQWMITKQEGKHIANYLHNNDIKSIAIYGVSYIGERLYDELKDSDIEIKYAIDKNAGRTFEEIKVLSVDDALPPVDAIIVTPVFFYKEIRQILHERIDGRIYSLEDIIYNL